MKPAKLDLPTVWRGCTYPVITFTWKDRNGDPIDLTGWTPHATSRNIDFHPVVTNAPQGITQVSLEKTETDVLKLGVERWDWIFSSNGIVTPPLLAGQVEIKEPTTET